MRPEVTSGHAVPSEASQLPDREAEMAGQASGDQGVAPAPVPAGPEGDKPGSSVRVPGLQRLALDVAEEAHLALRDSHTIRPLVGDQAPFSGDRPYTQLRTEDRPLGGETILMDSYFCADCGVTTEFAKTFTMPLTEFVCGHEGFRCLQCGAPIIIINQESETQP